MADLTLDLLKETIQERIVLAQQLSELATKILNESEATLKKLSTRFYDEA